MDDEGTKRLKQMILYSAITSHFIWRKRRGPRMQKQMFIYTDGQHMETSIASVV